MAEGLSTRPAGTVTAPARTLRVGVHTPLNDTTVDGLTALWRAVDADVTFDWLSVWDHLGSLDGRPTNLEAVAAHTTLAAATRRVICGSLVYCVGYRPLLVLADAIATIDHVSGGRAALGIGAGYLAGEYAAQGRALPAPGERIAHLAEAVGALRRLFDGETVTTAGTHVVLERAQCSPPPVQAHLPIIIGGGGERRTIPLAATVADGWNVPMVSAVDLARKVRILREHEAAAGRPVGAVEASASIGLCFDERQLATRFGARVDALRPAICTGSTQQVVDTVAAYAATGVDRLVLSMRPPYDAAVLDDLARFAAEVAPAIAGRSS